MKKGIEIPYPAITVHAIQRLNSNLTVTYDDGQAARHTLGPQSLYMQLDLSPPSDDDEFSDPVELILAPAINEADSSADSSVEAQQEEAVKALYAAVSACSNLHPDPVDEDDEEEDGLDDRIVFEGDAASFQSISGLPGAFTGVSDGGLPPPFPGSGGWITAENVDQFFDKDGNYIAATEDAEEEEQGGEQNEEGKRTNGTHEDADEQSAKRTRTE